MATIIGAGNMARGIGARFAAGGEAVTIVDRDPAKAQQTAEAVRAAAATSATVTTAPFGSPIRDEVVVLAVPYPALAEVVQQYDAQLAGKIVVDITNLVNATYDDLATPSGTSAAEEVASLAPRARVVKAFNTTFSGALVAGQVAGQPPVVFLASDDADAKARVAQLVQAGGLRALDAGPLKRARQLEGLGLLHITQQFQLNTGFGSAVKIIS